MSTKNSQKYTINFIESLKNSENIGELPKETVQYISDIDKELNKYFKFLLEKKPSKFYGKKGGDKKFQDNAWRNKQQKRKKLFANEDGSQNAERDITLLLNKININNYEKMKKNILDKCKDKSILEYTVENMFTKAVSQPGFCDCYVKLYKDLISLEDESNDCLVSNLISGKCDSYLDIFKSEIEEQEELDEYEYHKQKDYVKGYSQFIGELHNNQVIGINKIKLFIESILKNVDTHKNNMEMNNNTEEYINSLYIIISCIGDKTYEIENYVEIQNKFEKYSKDSQLTSKGKFKFMDICDLLKK